MFDALIHNVYGELSLYNREIEALTTDDISNDDGSYDINI